MGMTMSSAELQAQEKPHTHAHRDSRPHNCADIILTQSAVRSMTRLAAQPFTVGLFHLVSLSAMSQCVCVTRCWKKKRCTQHARQTQSETHTTHTDTDRHTHTDRQTHTHLRLSLGEEGLKPAGAGAAVSLVRRQIGKRVHQRYLFRV